MIKNTSAGCLLFKTSKSLSDGKVEVFVIEWLKFKLIHLVNLQPEHFQLTLGSLDHWKLLWLRLKQEETVTNCLKAPEEEDEDNREWLLVLVPL